MPVTTAIYKLENLAFSSAGKIIASFNRTSGQGVEVLRLIAATQAEYALGSSYSLVLAPSTPDAQPVIVPEAVPQTVSVTPGQQPMLQPPLPQQPILQYQVPQPMLQPPLLVPQLPYAQPQGLQAQPQPIRQQPQLVPQLQEPSYWANQAYIAARNEAAAHAQMQREVDAMMAKYLAEQKGKKTPELTEEHIKVLNELVDKEKGKVVVS